jgi:chitodextrinase
MKIFNGKVYKNQKSFYIVFYASATALAFLFVAWRLTAATVVVTFDNPAPPGSPDSYLSGMYSGIDWGTNQWRWSGPFAVNSTNSAYFGSGSGTSRVFTFSPDPRLVNSMRVYTVADGTLTLSDGVNPNVVQSITTGSMQTVTTNWTEESQTVTVSFTGGWSLGIDDIEHTDATPPLSLTITDPAEGSAHSGTTVHVAYMAQGDLTEADHAHFRLDGGPTVMDMDFDGSLQLTNVPVGSHTLTGIIARSNHSEIAGSEHIVLFTTVVDSSDPIPPVIAITSPTASSSISGTVSLVANATDNVAIAGVSFLVDDMPLGPDDTAAPYSFSWDTTLIGNGAHVLTARARDTAGNETVSAPVEVVVDNISADDPSVVGQWSSPFTMPIVAVNMMLMHTGKVLMWDGDQYGNDARVFDPSVMTYAPRPNSITNMFCASQTFLPNGDALVVGGHAGAFSGLNDANLFSPATENWTPIAPMSFGRWYPTATTLSDGRVLVVSGSINCSGCNADTPEVYDPATGSWTSLTGAQLNMPLYPFMFQLPDGRVLYAGSDEANTITRALTVATQTWTTIDPVVRTGGSAVMFRPGVALKAGSPGNVDLPPEQAVNTAYLLDMNAPAPAWRQVGSMAQPRVYHTLTALPDGTVIVTGGVQNSDEVSAPASLTSEIWDPATELWSTMATGTVRRSYHSTGLLLPDGRVLVAGSGRLSPMVNELRGEFFSPPYLFKGARPVIDNAPATIQYGSPFMVETTDGAAITSVSLMGLGAVTHQFDANQRYVPLSFSVTTGGLNVTAPASATIAPPGYYMIFLVNSAGAPSIARFVHIDNTTQDFLLRFYGHGITAPDLDRVKIQIDDPANSNPGPPADIGAQDFTLEFWMRGTQTDNPSSAIACGANNNWINGNTIVDRDRFNQDRDYGISVAGGRIAFGIGGQGTGEYTICSTASVLDNAWHHIAAQRRRSDGFLYLYIDGILQASADGPDGDISYPDNGVPGNFCNGPCTNSDPYIVIGAEKHDAGSQYPSYNGFFDELRISNTLRYTSNFTRPLSPFTTDANTMALYHFNEGSGDVIADTSGVSGGPSNGTRRFGGSGTPGPAWQTSDVTYGGGGDTTPPSIPTNLTATPQSSSQINLSWTASTDNVGVTGYRIYRCAGTSCTPTLLTTLGNVTTFNNTGLSPSTAYRYQVTAQDAAGNESGGSAVATATTQSTPPPSGGLVASYNFDEGSGTALIDSSGNNNNGVISGATWTTGQYGGALLFNGNDNVTLPSLTLPGAFTYNMWVRRSNGGGWRAILTDNSVSAGDALRWLGLSNGQPVFWVGTGGEENYFGSVLTTNTWYHLAVTYDGLRLRGYMNGAELMNVPRSYGQVTDGFRIGQTRNNYELFTGTIDNMRIYNRALTASEIIADMNTGI